VIYRPTVHYAYHPCDDALLSAHEFCGRNYVRQEKKRILMDEISPGGIDELGCCWRATARTRTGMARN
jgi:homospermidine synthase